uniref:hypothetical protein n=1 Tax=Paractinoplanes polyasparticus TaxID=2856853 RepID=UPI001C8523B0|nr:hypothetical protein [Actinoplanes polyasparticus]
MTTPPPLGRRFRAPDWVWQALQEACPALTRMRMSPPFDREDDGDDETDLHGE